LLHPWQRNGSGATIREKDGNSHPDGHPLRGNPGLGGSFLGKTIGAWARRGMNDRTIEVLVAVAAVSKG
jgi:hypothetical protein